MTRALLVAVVAAAACGHPAPKPYVWNLPAGLLAPVVPADNPMSVEKIALGRYLFYEKRLSGNGTTACGTCHQQKLAFTDGLPLAKGSTGATLPRGSMMLGGTAYNDYYGWSNPLLTTFEEQMQVPMFGDSPIELGVTGHEDTILAALQADPSYQTMFEAAFPDEKDPYTLANVIRAIACFERTLFSANAPYDIDSAGGMQLSNAAQRGKTAFFLEKLDCYHCHGVPNFTSGFHTGNTPPGALNFTNDGIYNLGGNGGYPADNPGLEAFTGESVDEGKFRAPSLRNIMVTAPYFHDGSAATIDDVIDSYAHGGRLIASGADAGDGSLNPNKNSFVKGFTLSDEDRDDLKAFLGSLTDETLMTDPALSDPNGS